MNIYNAYKLITKEDRTHIHKLLGVVCLLHFGYRFFLLFSKGTMYLSTPWAQVMVCTHGILSCSSLIFHIPSKRIKGGPMIYPEYRLHSIIFALRSVICCLLTTHGVDKIFHVIFCFVTMFFADIITEMHPSGTTTMRQMPILQNIDNSHKRQIVNLQTAHQVAATLFMVGNEDSCFSPLFSIQLAAFLMTLVRKSIISCRIWHVSYNLSLGINILCYCSLSSGYIVAHIILVQIFFYWRLLDSSKKNRSLVGNKYIGWFVIFCLYLLYVNRWVFSNNGNSLEEQVTDIILRSYYGKYFKTGIIAAYCISQCCWNRALIFNKHV